MSKYIRVPKLNQMRRLNSWSYRTLRAVLDDPKFSRKFQNFENFVNRKEAFFQIISETPEAMEGPEIWNPYFHFFKRFQNLCSPGKQGRHKGVVRRTTSRTQQQRQPGYWLGHDSPQKTRCALWFGAFFSTETALQTFVRSRGNSPQDESSSCHRVRSEHISHIGRRSSLASTYPRAERVLRK